MECGKTNLTGLAKLERRFKCKLNNVRRRKGGCWQPAIGALVFASASMAQVERISTPIAGGEANHGSYQAALSYDGSVVAFRSTADNLVAGDINQFPDVFVRDMVANTMERANVDDMGDVIAASFYRGAYAPSISDDGQRVAFNNYTGYADVWLRDRLANTTVKVFPLTGSSTNNGDREARQEADLSGNGQFLAFHSIRNFQSSGPVEARPKDDDGNSVHDVFWYDLQTMPTPSAERLSRPDFADSSSCVGDPAMDCPETNADAYSASISDDGQRVAFYSFGSNLVVADTNDYEDVFVKFRFDGASEEGIAGPIVRVSVSSMGAEANDASKQPVISGDGNVVAFRSLASNLVAGDTNAQWDIFVHDLSTSMTTRVSVSSAGEQANHDSFSPSLSADGRYVVFRSNASNLVANDDNQRHDIFVHDRQTGQTAIVSEPGTGNSADGHSYEPAISGDGNWIAFESDATNLVVDDTNSERDIFRAANPL